VHPTHSRVAQLVVLVGVLAAGCGSQDDPPPGTADRPTSSASTPLPSSAPATPSGDPSSATDASPSSSTGTRIITAGSDYGPMLYDGTGQPIYLFTAESGERPACYDGCAEDWPPVLTDGEPTGDAGVRRELLGSTQRADGSTQVTYAGHPLYFYAHEGKYEVLCHDVEEYGGTWLVVQPDGTPAAV
jgi:predicted lipoprotein with Yx(FWY)xxD motif